MTDLDRAALVIELTELEAALDRARFTVRSDDFYYLARYQLQIVREQYLAYPAGVVEAHYTRSRFQTARKYLSFLLPEYRKFRG